MTPCQGILSRTFPSSTTNPGSTYPCLLVSQAFFYPANLVSDAGCRLALYFCLGGFSLIIITGVAPWAPICMPCKTPLTSIHSSAPRSRGCNWVISAKPSTNRQADVVNHFVLVTQHPATDSILADGSCKCFRMRLQWTISAGYFSATAYSIPAKITFPCHTCWCNHLPSTWWCLLFTTFELAR